MIRPSAVLLGPELYWVVLFAAVKWMAVRNLPSTPEGNQSLERLWYLLPLVAVPLSFVYLWAPEPGKWSMLLRIDLAACVGLIACELVSTSAIDYHNSRNSGTAAGFFLAVGLGIMMLGAANIVTAGAIWWRGRT